MSDENLNPESPLSYKGSLSGLRGLLGSKIAEGFQNVAQSVARQVQPEHGENLALQKIPIARIHPCADQPRLFFDPRAIEELAKTFRQMGQIQAITVRPHDGDYEIISGERRYRAAKLAGFVELDCVVKQCSREEARLMALVENIQREDLLPMEEAHYLKKILGENKELTLEQLANKLGSHKSTLSEKMKMTEIPEIFQKRLFAYKSHFTHRHWRIIARIEEDAMRLQVLEKAVDEKLSVADLEKIIQTWGLKTKVSRVSRYDKKDKLNQWIKSDASELKMRAITFKKAEITPEQKNRILSELDAVRSWVHDL